MTIAVYVESGTKRVFAGALDWPGWCRSGRDEATALEALLAAAPRYGRVLRGTRLGFEPPVDARGLRVRERLAGDATTDFGAPSAAPSVDAEPVRPADLKRFEAILRAGWRALDRAAGDAEGRALAKGPRGGGRSLEAIVRHVEEAEAGYLGALGWKAPKDADAETLRTAVLEGLAAATRGEIASTGPRGGRRWLPRYFVRRTVWHALDHAWEIEDRTA